MQDFIKDFMSSSGIRNDVIFRVGLTVLSICTQGKICMFRVRLYTCLR